MNNLRFLTRALLLVVVSTFYLGCTANSGTVTSKPGIDSTPRPLPSLELGAELPQDPAVIKGVLDNGLTYYIRENNEPEQRAELRLVVKAGSILEDEDQLGLAHFVEHMAFNGTEKFEKHELIEYLESIGMRFGADLNAYTSFDETVYQLQLPTDDPEILGRGLEILSEWASGVTFDPEEVERERGVVIEEWRSGRGASARIRDKQFPVILHGSRYADRLPIGTRESLETFEYDSLVRFYRDWYRPELMAIVAVGDFDASMMRESIVDRFSGLENPESPRERFESDVPGHDETLVSIVTDPELTTSNVSALWKYEAPEQVTVGDYRDSLVESIFNSLLNARLRELTQQAEPPFLNAYSSDGSFIGGVDLYTIGAAIEAAGIERGLQALLTESERARRFGFAESELDRARQNFLRGYQRFYEERDNADSGGFAAEYIRNFLQKESFPGIEFEYALVKKHVPTITVDEINAVANRVFGKENRVISATLPEKDGLEVPDDAEILASFDELSGVELEPWVDRVREGGLIATMPEAGSIVGRAEIESLGATLLELSNGARVFVKTTDFKDDEILFSAYSPGGTSLVSDADYVSAASATDVVSMGGVGDFDLIELQKTLAGKAAGASPYISELGEGFSGGGSPQDIETLFQMVYMYGTMPRCDETAFASFRSRMSAVLENQTKRPEVVFGQEVARVMSQNHLRRRPMTEEILGEMDLERACRVYRDRFADFSDFTFLFVGAIDTATLEPMIEQYLASLPSAGREEQYRDIGVRPPEGKVERTIERGLEPKSRVQIIFTGAYEPSVAENHRLQSMTTILNTRLRETLREELGGTYGASVSGRPSWEPVPQYRIAISFACDPEQVDTLVASAFDEMQRLKSEAVEESELANIKEQQRREHEVGIKTNRFWIGSISFYDRNELDYDGIFEFDQRVEALDTEDIRNTAERYLDFDRYAQFILKPEAATDAVED